MELTGTHEMVIESCQTLLIHDSPYYQLSLIHNQSKQVYPLRINPEAFYPNPQVGDVVAMNWVMGMVMGAEKVTRASVQ